MASSPELALARGQAPGKIILFGEHAVVYGRPAIAVPVQQVHAYAEIWPDRQCVVEAADLQRQVVVRTAAANDPLAQVVRLVCAALKKPLPRWRIHVWSQIPMAAGLGSGAAIATAMARALLTAFDQQWEEPRLSALVYQVEKLHHGTPSGIDNTVVVYERPVWFVRGQIPQPFATKRALHLLIADTGIPSATKAVVADVNKAWQQDKARYEALFDAASVVAHRARAAILAGHSQQLGPLMTENQRILAAMGVSSPEIARLVRAAHDAGAWGAKLSGGGRGGNIIALAPASKQSAIAHALTAAGAVNVIQTTLSPATVV
jgi:mevalonate kinase